MPVVDLIVYLCSPSRWMSKALPLLLLMRKCFSRPNARHISCKCECYWGGNRWAIGWSEPCTHYHLYKTSTLSHKVDILHCLFADVMVSKSEKGSITFVVGQVTFVDLLDQCLMERQAKCHTLLQKPSNWFPFKTLIISNRSTWLDKAVYLLEGSNWPNKLLFVTTNKNGWAAFSLNTANLKADLNLVIRLVFCKNWDLL